MSSETAAAAAKVGVWKGNFVAPWDWRRRNRLKAEQSQQAGECLIKGNISNNGERIYHVPGGEYYDRTRISAGKGERWFCSGAEARSRPEAFATLTRYRERLYSEVAFVTAQAGNET